MLRLAKASGCALLGGETAEMPGHYIDKNFDLAGFSVGIVDEQKIINGSAIASGNVIIGIESSGPHSNGYSLIRKIISESSAPKNEIDVNYRLGTKANSFISRACQSTS